jgi:hypothetical protein
MLDLLGILFSTIMMVLVILRAVRLDSTQPWFRPAEPRADSSGLKLRAGAAATNRAAARTAAKRE